MAFNIYPGILHARIIMYKFVASCEWTKIFSYLSITTHTTERFDPQTVQPVAQSLYRLSYAFHEFTNCNLHKTRAQMSFIAISRTQNLYSRKIGYSFPLKAINSLRHNYNNIQGYLTFRGPCIVSIFLLIYFQREATLNSLCISGKLLYMFRVVSSPIIRSTYNCIYSIWYLLTVTAFCLYCGRVGAGLSVVWELYRSEYLRHTV